MSRVHHSRLEGHLTEALLETALDEIAEAAADASGPITVILDCSEMTGYELASRQRFVDWNAEHRDRVHAMAIVVTRPLWFAVVATMSMLSRHTMKAFRDVDEAERWAAHEASPRRP